MQRRHFIHNGSLFAAMALCSHQSLASLFRDPSWKIRMLTDNVGIFSEKGGTILFMLSKDGIIVVDSQFPDTAPHLIAALKEKTDQPFRLLINTHHHGDHSSGNIAFKGLVQHVLAHHNSKANQERVAREKETETQQLYPDQTFGTTWCEKFGKEEVCLHYYGEGHTNGDALVHFKKANIVHMGDLVFNRRHPFVDRSSGASINNWISVLDKAYNNFDKNTQYVCGHAAAGYNVVVGRDDIRLFSEYLGNVLRFTEKEIRSGKTKEEVIKATAIPGSPEWNGDGIERPLAAAFDELTVK